jgi:hypothetical protein
VPLEDVLAHLTQAGPFGRDLRRVLALLLSAGATLPDLVAATGVPRRTVERLVRELGPDLLSDPAGLLRVPADRAAAYRAVIGLDDLAERSEQDVVGHRLERSAVLERTITALVEAMPRGRRDLDHVAATGRTALRRALWLDSRYDLEHAHLVCIGDHDLTSVAVAMLRPEAKVTVVDLDEAILQRIDRIARHNGLGIHCLWADLRFGLPSAATGVGHLVVTDPPYTPDGVRLFCTRSLEALADREQGRLVLAYGHAEHQPALGLAVQQAVQSLQLTFEAILPGFNAYSGAQAIGSRSDLYLLRPTAKAWRALPRFAAAASDVRIYTHGKQAVESAAGNQVPAGIPVPEIRVAEILVPGPPPPGRARPDELSVDASADPGPWLLRLLLALEAARLSVLLPNAHPDIATEAGLRALRYLVGAKYAIRVRRSTPDPKHAVLEATPGPGGLVAELLRRAHGKLGNAWREALLATARARGLPLTKNQARDVVAAHGRPEWLGIPVLELPRHQLVDALADVLRSEAAIATP